jgi:hypothetical protein
VDDGGLSRRPYGQVPVTITDQASAAGIAGPQDWTFGAAVCRYVVGGWTGTQNAPDYLLLGNATGGFTTLKIPETTAGGEHVPVRAEIARSVTERSGRGFSSEAL